MADETKLTRIDASNIGDHIRLTPDDEVYFWREYTSHRDYTFGPANNLISNLKKKPSTSSDKEKYWKGKAIGECARFFSRALNMGWLAQAVMVPIPPSKIKTDPDYDDRITRICRGIQAPAPLDIRELVYQAHSTQRSHEGDRLSVEDLVANYRIDEALVATRVVPDRIIVFDDVLTNGDHFRAMCTVLSQRFQNVRIVGCFVARRVFPNDEAADFDLSELIDF